MAYYLQFVGGAGQTGQHVLLASRINIQTSDNFSILIDARIATNANFYRPLGADTIIDNAPRVLIFGGGRVRLTTTGGVNREWFTGINLTTIETIEFRRVSGTLDLLVNGTLQIGSFTSNTDSFLGFQVINGNFSNVSEVDNSLYRLKFTVNDILLHDYSPGASNGTGLVLTDIVGGNNGTLPEDLWPEDDSQWVFYDGGGGTPEFSSTITSTTLLPTSLISLDKLNPEYSTIINSMALLPSGSVSLDTLPPEYSIGVVSNTLLPVSYIALNNELPSNSLIVTSESLLPTSSVILDNILPEYSANIVSNTLLPVSSLSLDNIVPDYSISLSSNTLLPTSSVNLDNDTPSNSVSIFSLTPLPTSSVLLNNINPSGVIISSSTLLPTSNVMLDAELNNSTSINSNTLLPIGVMTLSSDLPELSAMILSNAPLPTSIIVLSNGSVTYYIGKGNLVTIKPKNNIVTIKPKSNFVQLRK